MFKENLSPKIEKPKIEKTKTDQPKNKEIENKLKDFENNYIEKKEKTKDQEIEDKLKDVELNETEEQHLTKDEKVQLKERTGWSDDIIDNIRNMKEAEIYIDANLKEVEINGKKCLIKTDIDWNQKDKMGRTNKERVEGEPSYSPVDKNGKPIELHHIGQKQDSPLAELTAKEHIGKGNYTILHNKDIRSEIDRKEFDKERKEHWKTRAQNA